MSRWPRRRGVALLAGGVVVLALYLARGALLPGIAGWLDVGERPRRADYVVVLGGGANNRPFVAAALVRVGLADRVLVTRGAPSPETDEGLVPPEHELSRAVLLHRGVPAEHIEFLGAETHSTRDEALAVAAFLADAPAARLTVVTDGYHTRRARWIFSKVLGRRLGQVTFVSAPVDDFRMETWWSHEKGFATIVGENLKLGFYVARYSRVTQTIASVVVAAALVLAFYGRRCAAARQRLSRPAPVTGGAS